MDFDNRICDSKLGDNKLNRYHNKSGLEKVMESIFEQFLNKKWII